MAESDRGDSDPVHRHGSGLRIGVIMFALGFTLMMALDVALG